MLILNSGIGPKSHLVQQGIEVKQDLPAVGQNLSDHNALPVTMDMPTQDTLHSIMSGFGFLWHFVLYVFFGRGLLACTSVLTNIFFRTTSLDANLTVQPLDTDGLDSMDASLPRNIPDAEIMVIPLSCVPNTLNRSQLTWWIALVQPESRGRVELASSDPEVHPRITYPLLDDKRDLVTARKAVRFALRLTDEMSASGYPHPTPMAFGPGMDMEYLESVYANERKPPPAAQKIDWRELSDGEIDKYVRRVCGTALHFSSTCRMSNDSRDGVVDQQLRVHGFSNLRVADASVFPKIPSTHTMAPVMMVAQRCFDFIRREYE
jgi:choline dehydrogenase-like flavoprotein